MVMRVGGIMSGMDIEGMVNKLMEAERMPLNRLLQQQTQLEWKRDAFRDINSKLLELDNLMLDMKLSRTYNPKSATSSQENAVRATANSSATNGTYDINVTQLATNAMNIGGNLTGPLNEIDLTDYIGEHTFHTYDKSGTRQDHTFEVKEGDSIEQVLNRINSDKSNNVRAFVDESHVDGPRVVLETTRTGVYNASGSEIEFDAENNSFFTGALQLNQESEKAAQNAEFMYNNNLTIESRDNSYTLNNITFEFNNVTEGNARISVNTDVDQSFDSIMNFVNKYNELIDDMNKSQMERVNRDFGPLLEEQKAEMTDKQIEQWEEKAKSGILRGESSIRDGMYALRQSLQGRVETGGEYTVLSQIGITTTVNYLDGGKLQVDEDKLKASLRDNPDDVYKLFTNSGEDDNKGLIHRFDDVLDRTRGNIEKQAGKEFHTLDNYTLGKRMKDINERISAFERRMVLTEQRYWNQFTAMERAIGRLSSQSDHLFAQFGAQ